MRHAVILAAGKGRRMLPLTKDTPKPLLIINGKPFISYLLDNLEKAGYEKVILVVHYLKEKIEKFLEEKKYEFEVVLIDQGEALGTGHAVNIVKNSVKGEFVVINGDDVYSLKDLQEIPFGDNYNYIYGFKIPDPTGFGVLVHEGEFLIDLEEKPNNPKSNLINTGLFKFTSKIFDALSKIDKSERGEYELTSAVHLLALQRKVKIKEAELWQPLGKIEHIPKVEALLSKTL